MSKKHFRHGIVGDRKGAKARRARFVQEYLRDFNQTQAAIRAGYSARSAHVTGHQLLKDPNVAAAVEAQKAERMARLKMSADEVLVRTAALARGSLAAVSGWDRKRGVIIKDSKSLTELEAYTLQEVIQLPDGSLKVKVRDPSVHLERWGRHLGLAGFAPPAAGLLRLPGGPAGVLLDGEGGVTIYLPDNGRGGPPALPGPTAGSDNGGPV